MGIYKFCLTLVFITFVGLFFLDVVDCRYVKQPVYGQPPPYHHSFYGQHPLSPYDHYQSSINAPTGTFYDRKLGILRSFPGGGVPILVDYHKRCTGDYMGVKPHPDQREYYYVCKQDCVIFGKCQNLQTFNTTSGQCVPYPIPEFVPSCTAEGRFPIYSDCTIYYKCDCDFIPRIYSCPESMIFSPMQSKCVPGHQCAPTEISTNGSYIPENCYRKFPPCLQNGTFRSPSDCSLYYNCVLQPSGSYLQTRYKCHDDKFFDTPNQLCMPRNQVACDCIQVAEIVYPKPPQSIYYPVYPAHFPSDSIVHHDYSTEKPCDTHTTHTTTINDDGDDVGVKSEDIDIPRNTTTTIEPITTTAESTTTTETVAETTTPKETTTEEPDTTEVSPPIDFTTTETTITGSTATEPDTTETDTTEPATTELDTTETTEVSPPIDFTTTETTISGSTATEPDTTETDTTEPATTEADTTETDTTETTIGFITADTTESVTLEPDTIETTEVSPPIDFTTTETTISGSTATEPDTTETDTTEPATTEADTTETDTTETTIGFITADTTESVTLEPDTTETTEVSPPIDFTTTETTITGSTATEPPDTTETDTTEPATTEPDTTETTEVSPPIDFTTTETTITEPDTTKPTTIDTTESNTTPTTTTEVPTTVSTTTTQSTIISTTSTKSPCGVTSDCTQDTTKTPNTNTTLNTLSPLEATSLSPNIKDSQLTTTVASTDVVRGSRSTDSIKKERTVAPKSTTTEGIETTTEGIETTTQDIATTSEAEVVATKPHIYIFATTTTTTVGDSDDEKSDEELIDSEEYHEDEFSEEEDDVQVLSDMLNIVRKPNSKTEQENTTFTTTLPTTLAQTPLTQPTITTFNTDNLELHMRNGVVQIFSNNSTPTVPICESKPVTNPNSTAPSLPPCEPANGTIPQLEIKVYEPLDLKIIYCPRTCNETHDHQFDPALFGHRPAVGIKWIPRNSNKTMLLQTSVA